MIKNFHFDPMVVDSLVNGLSTLKIPKLNIQNIQQAYDFIKAYGFDLEVEEDEKKLWAYHMRAVTYIQTELIEEGEFVPEAISDPNKLKNLSYILIYASTQDQRKNSLQKWSCAVLKVVHVLVHLDNDLFRTFSSEIQEQILKPIQSHIYQDPATGISLGSPFDTESVPLKRFDLKPFKRSDSSVTKLLAKPEEVAFRVLDNMGVCFVTKSLFDAFRVMRYLIEKNIISFPHNIPDQSNNTLYPSNLMFEVVESLNRNQKYKPEEIDELLRHRLKIAQGRAQFKEKLNVFSSPDYKFIKFINRKLVTIEMPESNENSRFSKALNFFYPFEVQIVDYNTFIENLSGPASHDEYKKRQKAQARRRMLGFSEPIE